MVSSEKKGSNHPKAQTMNNFMCLIIWYILKKGKGAGHGGESHLLLPRLCRWIRQLLVMSKLIFFLRMAKGSENSTGWGGMGKRCPPMWVQLTALPAWGLPSPRGARRMQPGTDCGLCWWLGAFSLGWHFLFSLFFSYRWRYKQG